MNGSFAAANTPPQAESMGLRRKLAQVRMRLACAEDLFNCATDEAMVDTSIYELKSLQVYYSFLMRQLREEGEQAEEADEVEEVPLPPLELHALSGDEELPELPEPFVQGEEGMVETMG